MRLLIDQNVSRDVADLFIARGHDVQLSRVRLRQDSPDPLLAFAAAVEGLVVVTHDGDFRRFKDLFPQGFRTQARKLTGRIYLNVSEVRAATRVNTLMEVIEFHYADAVKRRIRLMMTVTGTNCSVIDNAPLP
jgi:hypothetical protein